MRGSVFLTGYTESNLDISKNSRILGWLQQSRKIELKEGDFIFVYNINTRKIETLFKIVSKSENIEILWVDEKELKSVRYKFRWKVDLISDGIGIDRNDLLAYSPFNNDINRFNLFIRNPFPNYLDLKHDDLRSFLIKKSRLKSSDYRRWIEDILNFDEEERHQAHYNSVALTIVQSLRKSEFWHKLIIDIPTLDQKYVSDTTFPLLPKDFRPELQTKTFDSFFDKTYRKNVLDNPNWPEEPSGGWIDHTNWFEKIDDIVRTRVIVKYLDGIDYVVSYIQEICDELDLKYSIDYKAKEEGYYAVHMYVKHSFEIPNLLWDTKRVDVLVEFQITTQLQEVIEKLTHKYYEKRRSDLDTSDLKWQWNYKSDEFASNYLGHILHYIEGMIMEVRRKQSGE